MDIEDYSMKMTDIRESGGYQMAAINNQIGPSLEDRMMCTINNKKQQRICNYTAS